jgi:selenocysteine lyase/cysteine desulfurase
MTPALPAASVIPSQRHLFDMPREVAYLNCAYMSPLLHSVVEAGTAGLKRKARPWEIAVDDFFDDSEALRAAWAELLGAGPDTVALTPSAGYGISLAANHVALGPGRRVLLAAEQFPSNVYPWTDKARRTGGEVRFVARPEDGDWTRAVLAELDERVAVVALPNVHWTDGGIFDLARIGARAREAGAALVVDATQSLGALPLDVEESRPDFVAGAGYKWLMGPYSLGYLYAAPHLEDVRPIEHNWIQKANAREFSRLVDYTEDWQAGARRLDCGERSNFALAPAALAAARQVLAWGPGNILDTLGPLTGRLAAAAADLGCTTGHAEHRSPHYLALGLPAGSGPDDLARVREALSERRVFVSIRGDTIRVTPHLYNDEQDCAAFIAALGAAL